jgi:PilZ domain
MLPERRQARRYPLHLEVRYELPSGESESGEVIDISSGGVRFRSSSQLPLGSTILLQVNWPVRIDGVIPLQLRVFGWIVRCDRYLVAVAIGKSEFVTPKKLARKVEKVSCAAY